MSERKKGGTDMDVGQSSGAGESATPPTLYDRLLSSVQRTEAPCDHEWQDHPASDDFGVCSMCGAERRYGRGRADA